VPIDVPFALGVYPVTQGQWRAVMGNNPSFFSRGGGGAEKVRGISDADLDHFPVECVSWDEVQEFLQQLNKRERESGLLYRLPAEAEWEYACRAGACSKEDCSFHCYLQHPTNDLTRLQANCDRRRLFGYMQQESYPERTSKVGSYPPNGLGIYDMHGNVWEWVNDLHESGSTRVIRGGSWFNYAEDCLAASRNGIAPNLRYNGIGFRLVQVPTGS
jgi:formylglycine-generating enzyme required for sulfatase activity